MDNPSSSNSGGVGNTTFGIGFQKSSVLNFYGLVYEISEKSQGKFYKISTFFLETWFFMLSIFVALSVGVYSPNNKTTTWNGFRYITLVINPVSDVWMENYFAYIIILTLSAIFVVLFYFAFFIIFTNKDIKDHIYGLSGLTLKFARASLGLPLLRVFSTIFRFSFTTWKLEQFTDGSYFFTDWWNVVIAIFSAIFFILTLIICFIDLFFFLDKFKYGTGITSSPNGRVNVFFFFSLAFIGIIDDFGMYNSWLRVGTVIIGFLLFLLMTFLFIRFIPFYKLYFVFYTTIVISISCNIYIIKMLTMFIHNAYVNISYLSLIITIIIVIISLFARFYINYKFYYKGFFQNFFFSYTHFDFSIISYHHKKRIELFRKYFEKKLFFSKSGTHQFLTVILELNKFWSSKIIKRFSRRNLGVLSDNSLAIFIYLKLIRIKMMEGKAQETKHLQENRKINSLMDRLNSYLIKVWGVLLEVNKKKVKLSTFPRLMGEIDSIERILDKKFDEQLKLRTRDTGLMRKFANYALNVKCDSLLSAFWFDKADSEEFRKEKLQRSQRSTQSLNETEAKEEIKIEKEKDFRENIVWKRQKVPDSDSNTCKRGKKNENTITNETKPLIDTDEKKGKKIEDEDIISITERTIEQIENNEKMKNQQQVREIKSTGDLHDFESMKIGLSESERERAQSEGSEGSADGESIQSAPISLRFQMEKERGGIGKKKIYIGLSSTRNSTTSSSRHTLTYIKRKIRHSSYFSTSSLRYLSLCSVVYSMISITVLVLLTYFTYTRFQNKIKWVNYASRSRHQEVTLRLYLRKLQNYGNQNNMYFDSNITLLQNQLIYEVDDFISGVNYLYKNSDEQTKLIWNTEICKFNQTYHTTLGMNETIILHDRNLLDTVVQYARSIKLLSLKPEYFYKNSTNVITNNDFTYAVSAENIVHMKIKLVILSVLEQEKMYIQQLTYWVMIIPIIGILFGILLVFNYVHIRIQLRELLKSFLLIPQQGITYVHEKLKGKKSFDKILSGGNSLFNESSIERSLLCNLIFVAFNVAVFIAIIVFLIYYNTLYVQRNIQVDYANHILSDVRRVHLDIHELVNIKNTIIPKSQLIMELEREINCLNDRYNEVRFGSLENDLPRGETTHHDLFYEIGCSLKQPTGSPNDLLITYDNITHIYNVKRDLMADYKMTISLLQNGKIADLFGRLMCDSMSEKYAVFYDSARYIQENYMKITMDDDVYLKILVLDQYGYESKEDGKLFGLLQFDTLELLNRFERSLDIVSEVVFYMNVLFLVLYLPFSVLFYIYFVCIHSQRVHTLFKKIRRLFLLLPKKYLFDRHVFEFFAGSKISSSGNILNINYVFLKTFSKTQQINEVFDVLSSSKNYMIFIFDKKFRILKVNSLAEKTFKTTFEHGIEMGMGFSNHNPIVDFLSLFDDESKKLMEECFKRGRVRRIPRELTMCINSEHKFLVQIEISYDKAHGKFIAFIQNLSEIVKQKYLLRKQYRQKNIASLLRNTFPSNVVDGIRLNFKKDVINQIRKIKSNKMAKTHKEASFFFGDISDFSVWTTKKSANELVDTLNQFFALLDSTCHAHKVVKIKTINSCFFAVSGVPNYTPIHALMLMVFAIDVLKRLRLFREEQKNDFHMKIGIASGSCVSGFIGKTKIVWDIFGDSVNLASRMCTSCEVDKIMIAGSTFEKLKDKFGFEEKLLHVKGKGILKSYVWDGIILKSFSSSFHLTSGISRNDIDNESTSSNNESRTNSLSSVDNLRHSLLQKNKNHNECESEESEEVFPSNDDVDDLVSLSNLSSYK